MSGRSPMRSSRMTITFLSCVLMVYACTALLSGVHASSPEDALWAGAVLGLAYLIVRPVLRVLTLPVAALLWGFPIL